jgi:hypothetical protein
MPSPRRSWTAAGRWVGMWLLAALGISPTAEGREPPADRLATPTEVVDSRADLWGEAALRQPDGPSYEFFKDLLPPLRYVNADFRVYPVILSAPAGPVKARWVGDGSAINARAHQRPMWREVGTPVHFLVGEPGANFGDDPALLDGPRYAEGFLPIVRVSYTRGAVSYEQEAFVPAAGDLADHGAVFVRFSVRGGPGTVRAQLDPDLAVRPDEGALVDVRDRTLVLHDDRWAWDKAEHALKAKLAPGEGAVLVVPTRPLAQPCPPPSGSSYDQQRRACADAWKALLGRGMRLSVPESIVQDAWRSLVAGNFLIADGDRMNYSVGNAYDHLYEGECGDATRSVMLFGFADEARGMVGPLLDFNRQATRYHVAGHKLQLLAHYYWVSRDADYLRAKEPVWGPVIDFVLRSRQTENGLLPPDRYAGDIEQDVYALNSNANCWRGLRDMSAVLADIGQQGRSEALAREARSFREAILKAVAQSEQRDVEPPFIPNALFGAEKAYPTLTSTRLGSYYDLMAPYIIGSGVFGPGSERETWMIRYLQEHGAIAMGMIRSKTHQGPMVGEAGVNVLYGLRYMLALLRRDDRGRALVGFYGHLAQAMTRGTFIGGEGSKFLLGDRWGRSFYLPPNSASNAMFLTTLRYLLVQDWDLDDDGRPETLRLLYGAPGRWLRDGAVVEVERAPSAFGALSFRVESRLGEGEVRLDVEAPPRRPSRWLVRPPLPSGWKATSARVAGAELPLGPDGAINLSAIVGRARVLVRVEGEAR